MGIRCIAGNAPRNEKPSTCSIILLMNKHLYAYTKRIYENVKQRVTFMDIVKLSLGFLAWFTLYGVIRNQAHVRMSPTI